MRFQKAPSNKKVGFRPLWSFDTFNLYFSSYWGKGKDEANVCSSIT